MKRLMHLACLALTAGLVLWSAHSGLTAPAQKAALKLWNGLSAEQQKQALLPFQDRERYKKCSRRSSGPDCLSAGLPRNKKSC